MENVPQFKTRRNACPLPEVGTRFGRLVVVGYVPGKMATVRIDAVCDCGSHIVVPPKDLWSGNNKTCGCQKHNKSTNLHKPQTRHSLPEPGARFSRLVVERSDSPRLHPSNHVVIDDAGEGAEGPAAPQNLSIDDVPCRNIDLATPPRIDVVP